MNKIDQKTPTNQTYRNRWRPDCPGATGNPKRSLPAEGYVQMQKTWTQSNYPPGSQGKHGDDAMASGGDSYSARRSSGGGY